MKKATIEQPCLSPSGSHSVDSQTAAEIISTREVVPFIILFLSSFLSLSLVSLRSDLFLSHPGVEGYYSLGLGFLPSASSAAGDLRCVAARWSAGRECARVDGAYGIRVWRSDEASSVLHLRFAPFAFWCCAAVVVFQLLTHTFWLAWS